jgi:hypothetical protein
VKCICCRILVYSGCWANDTPGFRRSWGKRLRDAIYKAVVGKGDLLGVDFRLTEPNSVGRAVTIDAFVGWWSADANLLVERIHKRLVARLKPESERQIEVEIVGGPDTEDFPCDI